MTSRRSIRYITRSDRVRITKIDGSGLHIPHTKKEGYPNLPECDDCSIKLPGYTPLRLCEHRPSQSLFTAPTTANVRWPSMPFHWRQNQTSHSSPHSTVLLGLTRSSSADPIASQTILYVGIMQRVARWVMVGDRCSHYVDFPRERRLA